MKPSKVLVLPVTLLGLVCIVSCSDKMINNRTLMSTSSSDKGRFLSLFTVVHFKNDFCTTTTNETGTCYLLSECLVNGGVPSGDCAQGFGVCCITKVPCGGTKGNNCTYLQNPGYPSTYNKELYCRQSIRIGSDICSVRLNIDKIDLSPPSEFGHCETDSLKFSQDTKLNHVCGTTIDNHFYLTVEENSILDFDFALNGLMYNRTWRIQVCQISCSQDSLPPSGCGQYYTESIGTIKGLNADAGDYAYYLSGVNYAICVRKNYNKCRTGYFEIYRFYTFCNDLFERPYPEPGAQVATPCYTGLAPANKGVASFTHNAPDYFYFSSVITSELPHHQTTVPFNYNIEYEQFDC